MADSLVNIAGIPYSYNRQAGSGRLTGVQGHYTGSGGPTPANQPEKARRPQSAVWMCSTEQVIRYTLHVAGIFYMFIIDGCIDRDDTWMH